MRPLGLRGNPAGQTRHPLSDWRRRKRMIAAIFMFQNI
jgi:hypothetical protein